MEEFKMKKFWEAVELCREPSKEVNIFAKVFFSADVLVGQIRESFDTWDIETLEELLEEIENTPISDDGVSEEHNFGERWSFSGHPLIESNFTECSSSLVWSTLRPRKKRFF